VASGPNRIPEELLASRIILTVGKFSLVDLFDDNAYSHDDARTQFMNWMDNGAWDFAADTRGYTYGAALEVYPGALGLANSQRHGTQVCERHADGYARQSGSG